MPLNSFAPNQIIKSAELNANFEGLADGTLFETGIVTADHVSAQEEWNDATLLNSWVDYGGSFPSAGYFKDHTDIVHVRGLVKDGTTSTGTIIFTLPSGYRPANTLIFPTISNNALGQVRVDSDGDVMIYSGSSSWFALDVMVFRADGS